MPNTAENAIYDRLSSAPVFHPSNADLFAVDWSLEPGDVVAVRSGDETYNVPVYAMRFEWKGMNGGESKVNIQSTGNQKRKPLPTLKRKQYASGRGAYETKQELKDKEIIYETRFDRTDRYFDLIATQSQWDALAQEGHVTAYSEILLNSRGISLVSAKTGIDELEEGETLYSKLEATAEAIATEVADRTNADTALQTSITQTAGSITSLAQKTGVNNLGENETLYSRITQTADAITSEVSRATGAESTLYTSISTVQQTADAVSAEVANARGDSATLVARLTVLNDAITTEVANRTNADTTLSSSITQNADAISAEVTRATGAESTLSGRITIAEDAITQEVTDRTSADSTLSGRITTEANKISTIVQNVGANGAVTAASIVAAINGSGSSVTINASKIYLNGQTIAQYIQSKIADVETAFADSLDTRDLTAVTAGIDSLTVYGSTTIETNLLVEGSSNTGPLTATSLHIGNADVGKAVASFGTATESGGQITIPVNLIDGTTGTSINFNIAATQYYQDGVAAAEATGWDAARAKVEPPAQGDSTSFTVKVPSATQNEQQTYTFTIQKGQTPGSTGYASVALSGILVGRIEIGSWYDAGVTAGAAGVTLSAGGWTGPSGKNIVTASNGESVEISLPSFTTSGGTSFSSHKTTVYFSTASVTSGAVASKTVDATSEYNSGYSAGWTAARGQVDPPAAGTETTFSFKVPSATEGEQSSYTYTLSKGTPSADGGDVSVSRSGTVVARISITNWWTKGYEAGEAAVTLGSPTWGSTTTNANNTFTVTASNDESKSQALYLTKGSWSSGSMIVYLRTTSTTGTIRARTTISMPDEGTWAWSNPAQGYARASFTINGKTYSNSKQIPSNWM